MALTFLSVVDKYVIIVIDFLYSITIFCTW